MRRLSVRLNRTDGLAVTELIKSKLRAEVREAEAKEMAADESACRGR
jgi:hypothetical protein